MRVGENGYHLSLIILSFCSSQSPHSRTIEVQEGQKVIDTGLYGIVRHPMYMATVIMFLSMPLVLGSPISFIIMLGYIPVIAKRIRNEEEVLTVCLDGYKEYKTRVKYKVIPCIW